MPRHDLVVIGSGSGNMVLSDAFADLDVAIVEATEFGGTCLNRGCIPTKMFAYSAEVADTVRDAAVYDVGAQLDGIAWPGLRDRVFGRLDPIAAESRKGREDSDFVTVYAGEARFTGPRTLAVALHDGGSAEIEAGRIVIAAGARPVVPPPVERSGLPFHTSDTIMRVDVLPRRLAVLGGGYIAAELAHVFHTAGAEIVMIDLADELLGPQDESVSEAFTAIARERYELHLGREVTAVEGGPGALRLRLDDDTTIEADTLLVAVGRTPNGDSLDLDAAGIETHDDGRVAVDAAGRTSVEGVWALGDVSSPVQLKHVANREAEVVTHNLRHPDDLREVDHSLVPAAVFTSPQIGTVGRTEAQCRDEGLDYEVGRVAFSDVAYGWAMEDETGFCKVLVERGTGRILGAHVLGPEAPTLIAPLALAMTFDIDAAALSGRPYWIHPALTEVVDNALRQVLPG
ncbi:mycothione reductase [Actinomycetospora soli]|uniref:mycothione reductase n=1 Tax=Actinomycetospora soli TaxID=2893887 RepID=UPI001E5E163B|nr:mycothione reductase [Actinomycetospora soli]MCD2190570.1 mycothione reductase [Actinomycetospora soli]